MHAVVGNTSLRAWQRMLSGRRLDLLDPSPLDVEIEDIAHGLARVARWNGQTAGPHIFSVAQHSLLVEAIADHLQPGLSSGRCPQAPGETRRPHCRLPRSDAPRRVLARGGADLFRPAGAPAAD